MAHFFASLATNRSLAAQASTCSSSVSRAGARARVWPSARRWAGALLTVGLLLAAAGCETQAPYASCQLDPEVTNKGVCNGAGSTGGATTSCVVTRHPHCVASVCLSYFSTAPVCTHACSSDADCEQGGWCWQFADNEKYCVPADRKSVAK